MNGESSPRINCCACCIAAGSRSDAGGVEVCLDLFLNFLELFDDLSDYPPVAPGDCDACDINILIFSLGGILIFMTITAVQ